ncbi:MAG: hypothetical protein AB1679_26420 [Actinomycetota bacterium]|jgi:hypothetical protein
MDDADVVLDSVGDHLAPFLLFSAISFVGLIVWYVEAIRAGERDRCISMPPVITFMWLAHDATFVAHFPDWFGGRYDHWLMQLYWVALLGTTLVECWFVGQLLRFGRREILPDVTQRVWTVLVFAGLTGAWAIWLVLKDAIADPLFQVTFALTVAMFPPFGMALLLRRRSARGQTTAMWAGFTAAPAGWFAATMVAFGPAFRSWLWAGLGLVTVTWGAATTLLVARARHPGGAHAAPAVVQVGAAADVVRPGATERT